MASRILGADRELNRAERIRGHGASPKIELVTVAVVRDPHDAIPLHGTFIGFPSDHLGMEVEVIVRKGSEPLSNTRSALGLANGLDR